MTGRMMSITDAIFGWRPLREFAAEDVADSSVHALLYAAVQAPAHHPAPWAFAVIKDREVIAAILADLSLGTREFEGPARNPAAIVVIYGRLKSPFVDADCWLAAGNIVLAARAMGLATCFLRDALPRLNTSDWKAALAVPQGMTAIAPIALGRPLLEHASFRPSAPEILSWGGES